MSLEKVSIILLFMFAAGSAMAETAESVLNAYAAEASAPGFAPSAQRGQEFFTKQWGVSQKMPDCTACHGKNLQGEGKHVITGKRIAPLSPAVNSERFTSSRKVEKWFKRNCTEVVGRECTPAEKADFIQFVSHGS